MVTLWNRSYIFSGKIKLPIVEQIICDAIEYDSYSTGEVILPPAHETLPPGRSLGRRLSPSQRLSEPAAKRQKQPFDGGMQLIQPHLYATTG